MLLWLLLLMVLWLAFSLLWLFIGVVVVVIAVVEKFITVDQRILVGVAEVNLRVLVVVVDLVALAVWFFVFFRALLFLRVRILLCPVCVPGFCVSD
jgi:hypothetical protein